MPVQDEDIGHSATLEGVAHVVDVLGEDFGTDRQRAFVFHPMLRYPDGDGRRDNDLGIELERRVFGHVRDAGRVVDHLQVFEMLLGSGRGYDGGPDGAVADPFAELLPRQITDEYAISCHNEAPVRS